MVLIFEKFSPKIHDYHKVAELIYDVDFRTYNEVFKNKKNAVSAIENLLLIEGEYIEKNKKHDTIDKNIKSKLYVVMEDTDLKNINVDIVNVKDCENEKHDIKNIIGMFKIVKGKDKSIWGEIFNVLTKMKSIQAFKFSYIYLLNYLVSVNINEDYLYIEELAIDECKRGKGFGTKITQKIIEKAKEKGFKRVVLDVDLRNVDVINLYESIGFKKFDEKMCEFIKKDRRMCYMEYIL